MVNSTQWIVRDHRGKLSGPHSTQAVLELINDGNLVGNEMIAKYPGGSWNPISKNPEFYDKLLDSMANEILPEPSESQKSPPATDDSANKKPGITSTDSKKTEPLQPNNEIPKGNLSGGPQFQNQVGATSPLNTEGVGFTLQKNKSKEKSKKSDDIELKKSSSAQLKKQKNKKSPLFPLLIFAIAFVFTYLAFEDSEDDSKKNNDQDKIHLIGPGRTNQLLDKNSVKKSFQTIIKDFTRDLYSTYISSQNKLVPLIEGDPSNSEIKSLLCLVYHELWPFAFQDSADLKLYTTLVQSTKALNPISLDSTVCESSFLITKNKNREAKSLIDGALEQYPTSPVLYYLKSESLINEQDFNSALSYIEKTIDLWPAWLKAHVSYAELLIKVKRYQEAEKKLKDVIKSEPQHKHAKLLLGILELKEFNNISLGVDMIQSALNSSEKTNRLIEADALYYLADYFLKRNDKKKALQYSEKCLALNSFHQEAQKIFQRLGGIANKSPSQKKSEGLYLGDQYAKNGDCFSAQAEYRAAFAADPTNAMAAEKAAKCLWTLNQSKEAFNYLEKAIQADPNYLEAYALLADYYSQKHNFAAAAKVLQKAQSLITQPSYEIMKGYATVELRRNNFKTAIDFSQKALKIYDSDIEANILLANSFYGAQEYKDSYKYALKAIDLDSTNSEAHIVYAKSLGKIQGVTSSVTYMQDLIIKYPHVLEYRQALGEIYKEDEKYQLAQQIFQQIVDVQPNNKNAQIALGESLQAQSLYDQALKAYLNAATADPSDAEPLFKAGLVYFESGRYKLAIQQFDRVLKINNLYPRAHYFIGKSSYLLGDLQKAIDEASIEKKINPKISDSYNLAGEIFFANKQYSKCAEEYQNAVKLRPQGADIYVKMARCYRLSGSLDIASSMLNIAASKESGYFEIYKEQGAVYEMLGDIRAAVTAYEKYLALTPNAIDKNEIQSRIHMLSRRQ